MGFENKRNLCITSEVDIQETGTRLQRGNDCRLCGYLVIWGLKQVPRDFLEGSLHRQEWPRRNKDSIEGVMLPRMNDILLVTSDE